MSEDVACQERLLSYRCHSSVSQSPAFEGRSLFGLNAETRGESFAERGPFCAESKPFWEKSFTKFSAKLGLVIVVLPAVCRGGFLKRESMQEKGF